MTANHVTENPAASAQRIESEYFGTQPDPLPERLPAGTKSRSLDGRVYTASSELALKSACDRPAYWGRWVGVGSGTEDYDTWIAAKEIDWTTVKRAPSANPPEAPIEKAEKVRCNHLCPDGRRCELQAQHTGTHMTTTGVVVKPFEPPATAKARDPYAIVQERHNYVNEYAASGDKRTRETRLAALSLSDNPLDRLAARRARHVSECRASLESDGKARREAVSTHPAAWPEQSFDDVNELTSTF